MILKDKNWLTGLNKLSQGQAPLYYAKNNPLMLRALIEAKADVNTSDQYGFPVLLYAMSRDTNLDTVTCLIEAKAAILLAGAC